MSSQSCAVAMMSILWMSTLILQDRIAKPHLDSGSQRKNQGNLINSWVLLQLLQVTQRKRFWRMQNLAHCWIVLDNLLVLFTQKATIMRTPKLPRRNAQRNRHLPTCRNQDFGLNCSAVIVQPFPVDSDIRRLCRAVQTQNTYDMCFHVYMICICPKMYILYLWGRRARERERERQKGKTKKQSDQQIRNSRLKQVQ